MRVINAPILGLVDANVVQNVTQGIVGDPIDFDDVNKEFYVAIATGLAGLLFSVLTGLYSCFVDRKLKQYEAKLEIQKDRLTRFEDLKQLMRLYKKPLVQSAFDLQSRLAQEVRGDLLRTFEAQRGRREKYALHSTLYLICEFLGWLEVIRQEIVFITGRNAATLNQILDAIRFQFSGETEIQGVPSSKAPGQPDADDQDWNILQLFGVELRAIGEVMLDVRSYEDSKEHTGLSVIGYAEFTRRYTKEPPKQEDFGIKVESGQDGKAAGSAAAAAPDTAGSDGDGDAEPASPCVPPGPARSARSLATQHNTTRGLRSPTLSILYPSFKPFVACPFRPDDAAHGDGGGVEGSGGGRHCCDVVPTGSDELPYVVYLFVMYPVQLLLAWLLYCCTAPYCLLYFTFVGYKNVARILPRLLQAQLQPRLPRALLALFFLLEDAGRRRRWVQECPAAESE